MNSGLNNITAARGGKCRQYSSCTSGENLCALFTHKAGPHENFVKVMHKTVRGFQYVRNKFSNVSDTKIKEGIFIGPHTWEVMQDKQFDEDLNETERNTWLLLKMIFKD